MILLTIEIYSTIGRSLDIQQFKYNQHMKMVSN